MPVCWLFATLTSNPPLYRSPFGLPPAYLLPPHRFNVQPATLCRSLLDFLVPSLHFNVQSVPPAAPFWTSSCLFTASPPLQRPIHHSMPLPFGLPHAFSPLYVQSDTLSLSFWTSFCLFTGFPPLQRPTCHSIAAPFWTSSCLPSTSTSNPSPLPHPFGLHLAYLLPPHRFNVQSTTLCRSLLDFLLPIYCLPTTSASNPPYSRSPFGLHPAFSPL